MSTIKTPNKMNKYQLPELSYAYSAMEPILDALTMELHYSKHHQAYINNLNKAIQGTRFESMYLEELFGIVKDLPAAVRNNAGAHYNHTFFWSLISPPTFIGFSADQVKDLNSLGYPVVSQKVIDERQPIGALSVAINQEFGSFEKFKTKFSETAMTRFGNGWAWLIYSEEEQKLKITSTPNQDNPLMPLPEIETGRPILGLDIWEHAYYLKYLNRRDEFVNSFWKVINWDVANKHYSKITSAEIEPIQTIL